MQPSVYRSIKTVSEQAIGNVIGALLAVTMVTIFNNHYHGRYRYFTHNFVPI